MEIVIIIPLTKIFLILVAGILFYHLDWPRCVKARYVGGKLRILYIT